MQELVTSLVSELVLNLADAPVMGFGLPFISEEGFALVTTDGDIVISAERNTTNKKATSPVITNDNFLILTNENSTILGA